MTAASPVVEFTVAELAERAKMTVRNVRAYSTRGLIAPPRLEGRTGYYSNEHLQRLLLIRTLLNRGFTLAAVEEALLNSPDTAPAVALDLINIFESTGNEDTTEVMSWDDLAALSGVAPSHPMFAKMIESGLLEPVDDDRVRLTNAGVIRPGAMAVSLGLSPEHVVEIVPFMHEHLAAISSQFVQHVSADITQPFLDSGLPAEQWEELFTKINALIPIASQVVLSMFGSTLREAIEVEIGLKLKELAEATD
ncbi:MAG TPA: MerR family transcriptional regulator [Aeromicrobium sp.]|nr:MerR family transcriptional regulator [Aeromicrobium sp.]